VNEGPEGTNKKSVDQIKLTGGNLSGFLGEHYSETTTSTYTLRLKARNSGTRVVLPARDCGSVSAGRTHRIISIGKSAAGKPRIPSSDTGSTGEDLASPIVFSPLNRAGNTISL
jgi:hypothetical protein